MREEKFYIVVLELIFEEGEVLHHYWGFGLVWR